jgi:VanZ family protein
VPCIDLVRRTVFGEESLYVPGEPENSMSGTNGSRFAVAPRWRWLIWLVYVTVWTTMLVVPVPDVGNWTLAARIDLKYLVAKTLHIGAYTLLTVLTGWLRPPARWRLLLLFFIMAHATVTELVQLHVPGRTGTLEDVGIDHCGVALGLLVSWRWWSEAS